MDRQNRIYGWVIAFYLCAMMSAAFIVNSFADSRYELDFNGEVRWVKTSWWGLSSRRFNVRLQHMEDWNQSRSYRPPSCLHGHEWFIQAADGMWSPIVEEMNWPPET